MTRASYTVDFKLSVVEWVRSGERSLREASKTFGVDRKCVRQWLRESSALNSARLRQGPQTRKRHGGRGPLSHDLDRIVLGYLLEKRRRGVEVEDQELREKAVEGAGLLGIKDFKASTSWLRGWKTRNGLCEPPRQTEQTVPVGSSIVSHVRQSDTVLLSHGSCSSCSNESELLFTQSDHVISHVITPDHTYCRKLPNDIVAPLMKSISNPEGQSSTTSDSYVELLNLPIGGHLLESKDPLSSSANTVVYQSMCVPSCDPILSCTLNQDEILSGSEVMTSSSSVSSLSPPKRSFLDTRSLLWPSLGCNVTSPITFPEIHDFTDPLTGLLANRRLQPVFPARPEILMLTTEHN